MKYIRTLSLLILSVLAGAVAPAVAADKETGRVLRLDGRDNNVRTGIGLMAAPWTLELWVQSDVARRGRREMLIAGGEYSSLSWVDNEALALVDGRLTATAARLTAPDTLDGAWHHVALVCDGRSVALHMDGRLLARRDTAYTILPGTIGVGEEDGTFTGSIDEVRIWTAAVSPRTLKRWAGRSLSPSHPDYAHLYAYYPLDDFDGETAVNWVGRGFRPFHLRNCRNKWRESAPLAYARPSDNARMRPYNGRQRLFNAVVQRSEWDCDRGSSDCQILKLRLAVQGSRRPMRLTGLTLSLDSTTDLSDVAAVHVYATGQKALSGRRTPLFGGSHKPARRLQLAAGESDGLTLEPGINYVLVTFDIAPGATVGHRLWADVLSYELDGHTYRPEPTAATVAQEVTTRNALDGDYLKVLQWNIWHGGVHLADSGRHRVISLLREAKADVVLMQEAYGIQQMAARATGYRMKSKSDGDNLALFTSLPMEDSIPWREPFKSNPAIVTMRCGHRVVVNSLWLRYAYRPEYTCYYPEVGGNPARWVHEDSLLALPDIRNLIENDVEPYLRPGMSAVVGGDFNACSHLDWTARAARFHHGYGPVAFPASLYMQQAGYHDSFRTVHPDETLRPEGTWAVIYGQTPYGRIDFVHSKGALRPVQSKIIRMMPEIDAPWPGDHAATLSVFRVTEK